MAVVLAMAMSPLFGGFEAEFIKTNTVTPSVEVSVVIRSSGSRQKPALYSS
jgi:hypothetical protein